MKGIIVAIAASAAALAISSTASAQTRINIGQPTTAPPIEAGVQLGAPSGASFKVWLDPRSAVDLGVARNFWSPSYVMNGDYLLHSRSLLRNADFARLPVYVGVGGRVVRFDDGTVQVGPRVPVGVEAMLTEMPLTFYAEVAPALEVGGGDTVITADADFGARVVF